jgi:hypothetical protein
MLKEGFMAYALTTYRPWYYNEVMDHKAKRISKRPLTVLSMVSIWKFFCFASSLFDIVIVVSGELHATFNRDNSIVCKYFCCSK